MLNHTKSSSSCDFSMKKVLTKMKKYQKGWDNQAAQRAASRLVKKRNKLQLMSILANTEKYREKVEQRELNEVLT